MAQIALERFASPPLELLEPRPVLRGVRLRHDTDWENAAFFLILLNLGRGKTFWHRSSQE
jgi:hypothetical protein